MKGDIRKALETRLSLLACLIDTQWENKNYQPMPGTPYQVVSLMLANPSNPEQRGTFVSQSGYMQVTLRFPADDGSDANSGTKAIEDYAQSLASWFYYGLNLAANGFTVTINRTPLIGAGVTDGDRYAVPVKIFFFANKS